MKKIRTKNRLAKVDELLATADAELKAQEDGE